MMKTILKHLEELGQHESNKGRALFWLLVDGGAAFVFFLGLATLFGYVIHYPPLHNGWVAESPDMSFQTSICFSVTGFVLLTIHRGK